MKYLVTGVNGQLGYDVIRDLCQRGVDTYDIIGSDVQDFEYVASDIKKCMMYYKLDICSRTNVMIALKAINPDVVIHCAAWTAVDKAEDIETKNKVMSVNYMGTANIADACNKIDCSMIYISTDYVFSGDGTDPWNPDCEEFNPLNYYGLSKLAGEKYIRNNMKKFFIVRTQWVFGKNGGNFVKTMINIANSHNKVKVINDQIGTPTYTVDLAHLLVDMSLTDKYGIYHASNEGGYISWYDFCKEIYKLSNVDTEVIPVTTEEYGLSKARRPFNSRLNKNKLIENGFNLLPSWKDALDRYLKEINYGNSN